MKITKSNIRPYKSEPEPGTLWRSGSGHLYLLGYCGYVGGICQYAALNIEDGNRWSNVNPSRERAVEGLTRYEGEVTLST